MLVRHILPWPHRHIHQPRSVYSTSLVTQSRFAGSSCPAPLLLFVFFCFLLLETEHLMEKACSPAPCAGNTRFLPPLPGTAPGAVQAAVPAATCSCCPASGSPCGGSGGDRRGRCEGTAGTDLVPAGPLSVLCAGQPQLRIGWSRAEPWSSPGRESAWTTKALPRHRSRQPAKPSGHLGPCPAPSMSPTLALLPSPTLWAPGLSLYWLCPTAHQCRAQAGNAGFPNNSILLPPAA